MKFFDFFCCIENSMYIVKFYLMFIMIGYFYVSYVCVNLVLNYNDYNDLLYIVKSFCIFVFFLINVCGICKWVYL